MNKLKELYNKYNFDKYIAIICIVSWIFLTLTSPYMLRMHWDEIHAWNIANFFGFIDIIKLMKIEGHTFIWYFILKPFTYFDLIFFPWIMKFLNWFFLLIAIIVYWRLAPINTFIKMLVTFSFPILGLYPVFARCYGIGIMFLFILSAMYSNRLKHPIWFAVLIFGAANTSLIAAIGAFAFSCIFWFDILKSEIKNKYLPALILLFTAASLFIQWHNYIVPAYAHLMSNFVLANFLYEGYKIEFFRNISPIIFALTYMFGFLLCKNNFRTFFFLVTTQSMLLYLFYYVYSGHAYHTYFLVIYIIIAHWILQYDLKTPHAVFEKIFSFCFALLMFFNLFPIKNNMIRFINSIEYQNEINCIKSVIPTGSVVYSDLYSVDRILPYVIKDFEIRNINNDSINSFNAYFYNYIQYETVIDTKILIQDFKSNHYLLMHDDSLRRTHVINTENINITKCTDYYIYELK